MIENRHPVSANFKPLDSGAKVAWFGRDLSSRPVEFQGRRILLVEDEPPLRTCLRLMLELEGFRVTEASNGAEAINLFNVGEFDLVITDFDMPVMQGDKLAVGIKMLAPSLPILMVTGSRQARCDHSNPVDALLNKPFKVADLRCVLQKLLPARPEPVQPAVVPALETAAVPFVAEEQMVAHLQV